MKVQVERAHASDVPQILAIHNEVLQSSTAIYASSPSSLSERMHWFEQRVARGYPVLTAHRGHEVLGFASFGDFRSWPGYAFTVEHTVHVAAGHRGAGVGRALMEALLAEGRAAGKHVMVGGIDAENVASIRFHQKLGFREVARMPEVGRKFERWLDLVLVQRFL